MIEIIEYIIEIILWTVILYILDKIFEMIIYRYIISPEIIKKLKKISEIEYLKSKTKGGIKKT